MLDHIGVAGGVRRDFVGFQAASWNARGTEAVRSPQALQALDSKTWRQLSGITFALKQRFGKSEAQQQLVVHEHCGHLIDKLGSSSTALAVCCLCPRTWRGTAATTVPPFSGPSH